MLYQNRIAVRRAGAEGAISLRVRRSWFNDPEGGNPDGSGEGKYNPATVEDAKKIIAALEKRVGERETTIEQHKASINTLTDRITAIETANRQKLEEQGDFSAVKAQLQAEIETLKPSAARAEALDKIIRESNEARIKTVPEQYRAMIPTDYPPEKLQTWLNANEPLLVKQPAPNFDAGAGAGGSGGKGGEVKVTEDDRRQAETAAAFGHKVTAEDIAKRRVQMTKAESNDKKD